MCKTNSTGRITPAVLNERLGLQNSSPLFSCLPSINRKSEGERTTAEHLKGAEHWISAINATYSTERITSYLIPYSRSCPFLEIEFSLHFGLVFI